MNDPYFGFKTNTRLFKNRVGNVIQKIDNVGRSCVAFVNNEAGVLFGNLSAADDFAFKTALLDERSRKMAFGTLERASAARILQRLACASFRH